MPSFMVLISAAISSRRVYGDVSSVVATALIKVMTGRTLSGGVLIMRHALVRGLSHHAREGLSSLVREIMLWYLLA